MYPSQVDSKEFRELRDAMDGKYQVLHRKGISLDKRDIQSFMRSLLSKDVIISIFADIWSKPVMTASFLVTAHLFTPDSNKCYSICIALRFPTPNTGVRIAELLQRIVAEWEIPCNKLFRVFTDNGNNGSNMVAAFKANNTMMILLNLMVMNLIQIALHQRNYFQI